MLQHIQWQCSNLRKSNHVQKKQRENRCYFSVIARSGFFNKTTEATSLNALKKRIQNPKFDEKKKTNNILNKIFSKKFQKKVIYIKHSPRNLKKKAIFSKKLDISKKDNKTISISETLDSIEQILKSYKKKIQKKTTLRTATKILSCFARRGNHPRINNLFSKYRAIRAKKTKSIKKLPLPFYRPVFFHAATPFIRLKTRRQLKRRRRKKLFQKINFRGREIGERQSYLFFSKIIQKSKKSTKSRFFREQIQTQRESLYIPKSRRKLKNSIKKQNQGQSPQNTVTGIGVIKNIRQLRDDIHKRAFHIKPRKWRYLQRKRNFFKNNPKAKKRSSFRQNTLKNTGHIGKKEAFPVFFSTNPKNRFKQRQIDAKKRNKTIVSNYTAKSSVFVTKSKKIKKKQK